MTDDLTLLVTTCAAFLSLAVLVGVKVWLRLWRDPNERSILVLVVGFLALVAIGVALRFGLSDEVRFQLLKIVFPAVTAAAAYRVKVHLNERREAHELGRGDPEVIYVVVAELRRLLHEIEQLEPCPTPACMAMRHRLSTSIRRLPPTDVVRDLTRALAHHAHHHEEP